MNNEQADVMLLFSSEGAAMTAAKLFPRLRTASTGGKLLEISGDGYRPNELQEQTIARLAKLCASCDRVYFVCDGTRETELIVEQVCEHVDGRAQAILSHDLSVESLAEAMRAIRAIDRDKTFAAKQADRMEYEVQVRLPDMMEFDFQRHDIEYAPTGISIAEAAALGVIAQNQHEIDEYIPEQYQQIAINYRKDGISFVAVLPARFMREDQAKLEEALAYVRSNEHRVVRYAKSSKEITPPRPLNAPALARAAFYLFNLEPKRTKEIAGELYKKGLITDPMTTGANIGDKTVEEIIAYLQQTVPPDLIMETKRQYVRRRKKRKSEEEEDIEEVPVDTSEAIRPVYFDGASHPDNCELEAEERMLYEFIWFRTVSTQMANSLYDTTRAEVSIGDITVSAEAYMVVKEGWQMLKGPMLREAEQENAQFSKRPQSLPTLYIDEMLVPLEVGTLERTTRAPGRFGIGRFMSVVESFVRPAQIGGLVNSLERRGYIVVKEGMINITMLGKKVASWMLSRAPHLATSSGAEDDLRALALIEEGKSADPELPVRRIVEMLDGIEEQIGFVPKEQWPPTQAEASFARAIAKRLGLDAKQTEEIVRTKKSCLAFIEANKKPEVGDCPECAERARKGGRVLDHGNFYGCSNHKKGCRFSISKTKVVNYLDTLGHKTADDEVGEIMQAALKESPVLINDFVSRRTGAQYAAFVVLKHDKKWGWQMAIELDKQRRSA